MPNDSARAVGCAVALLLACGPACLAAQSDVVPIELARMLAAPPGATTALITSAVAPSNFPRALLPPAPITILGGIQTGPVDARIVGLVPAGQEQMIAAFTRSLAVDGWQTPPLMLQQSRGFVSSAPSGEGATPTVYCHADTVLTVRDAPRVAGGRYLLVSTSVPRLSLCNQRSSFAPDRPYGDAPLPTLLAPVGTQTVSVGTLGGGDAEWHASARLGTGLAPAALVAHYAPQLAAQGWTLHDRATAGATGIQTAERTTANGEVWHAILVVEQLPAARSDVSLRLARVSGP